jgi:hypothetical protein
MNFGQVSEIHKAAAEANYSAAVANMLPRRYSRSYISLEGAKVQARCESQKLIGLASSDPHGSPSFAEIGHLSKSGKAAAEAIPQLQKRARQ